MNNQDWLSVARMVLVSRRIDLIEETELAPAGKVTYQFSSKGHELAQILLAHHLSHPHDGATVYYRSRPFVLAAGMSIAQAFAGPLGRATGRSGGRDIGVVHHLPKAFHTRTSVTVLPASGDVGAQFTPAVGWAQAVQYRTQVLNEAAWENALGVTLAGDGAVAANGFWAALTIATTQQLPMLFLIEDNGYGISVPSALQTPGGNIAANLRSFGGLTVLEGSGTETEETAKLVAQAVKTARTGKPVLLRLTVPRLMGHSGADNQAYKSAEQIADEQRRDPVERLKAFLLKKKILTKTTLAELEADVEREVRSGLEQALHAPEPAPETATKHLFFDGKMQIIGGMAAEQGYLGTDLNSPKTVSNTASMDLSQPPSSEQRVNLLEAVKRVLDEELHTNPRLLVFGEDVGVKGGVHGATVDLQRKYGVERVFDTSLSEEGIIGRAVGMAFAGLVPVPEIQFRKYADPATEQLNDCGTIRWRTNGDFAAPMVVRIPVGYGKRTGDPWHSVSNEAIFAHTLGWRIAFPSNARDAAGLLRTALRGNDPTFFFEHRALLDTAKGRSAYPAAEFTLPFGKAAIVQAATSRTAQLTVISWGEMLHRAVEAAQMLGERAASVEILDLRTIIPWDKEAVLESVRRTARCLVLHEDTFTAGFGGEIAATVAQECFRFLDAPVERLATQDVPIPYNPMLMDAVVPQVAQISERMAYLLAY
jgi:2-oxoisovalerate dehydrogenase E1 component